MHVVTKPKYFMLLKKKRENIVFCMNHTRRLILYVTGNKDDGGNNHVSLYVRIEDTESLPTGWEVNVDLKLFVFNARRGKYLTVTGMCFLILTTWIHFVNEYYVRMHDYSVFGPCNFYVYIVGCR